MKKALFVVLALVVVVGMVQASDMRFGVKAGLTLGNVNKDVEELDAPAEADKKMRMALTFGAMMHMPVGENMVFMAEGSYVPKGVKIEYMGDEMIIRLDYFQFDAMMKYLFSENFGLFAGPGMGLIMKAEEEFNGEAYDFKDNVETLEFSLNIGGQFMATENVVIDARYNMGLTNVPDEGDFDLKNNVLSLTVGYLF